MDEMRTGVVLIGLGGVLAGAVGIVLPARHRLGAVLALVAGAGAGVIALAFAPEDPDRGAGHFLLASALGLVVVVVGLVGAWVVAARDRRSGEVPSRGPGTDEPDASRPR
jgi:hypothetical protein